MKNLLIATDFSDNAKHAAEYGYALACKIGANLVLCNAFVVPVETPQGGVLVWPQYDYEEMQNNSGDELKQLEVSLQHRAKGAAFRPCITRISEDGNVPDVINNAAIKENIGLVIMGTHGHTGISGAFLGNHSRKMIDDATCPLLLVPPAAAITGVKKIAFATDFKEPEKDLEAIFELIPLLKQLNAELLLTHIYNEMDEAYDFKKNIESFLLQLSNKANYPHIYYRIVKSEKPRTGLDWLCHFGNVDMLAMVHRKHSFFDKILNGSQTQKMAEHITIPLLVIPEK